MIHVHFSNSNSNSVENQLKASIDALKSIGFEVLTDATHFINDCLTEE